jgi:hypothetical protein
VHSETFAPEADHGLVVPTYYQTVDDRIRMSDAEAYRPRNQAYSLLKVAEAIEEASGKACPSTYDEAEQPIQIHKGATSLMHQIQQEQRSILSLVKSSLSDIATSVSKDSSEIPFDEHSSSCASRYSDSRKLNLSTEEEGRDNDDQDQKMRSTDSERSAAPSQELTISYTSDTRRHPTQAEGSYAVRLNSDQPQKKPGNMRPSSFSIDSSLSEASTYIEKKSRRESTDEALCDETSTSSDSDDTINQLRHSAEYAIEDRSITETSSSADAEGQSCKRSVNMTVITRKTVTTNHTMPKHPSWEEECPNISLASSSDSRPPRPKAVVSQLQKSQSSNRLPSAPQKDSKPKEATKATDNVKKRVDRLVNQVEGGYVDDRNAHTLVRDALLSLKRTSQQYKDKPDGLVKELTRIAALSPVRSTPQKANSVAKGDVRTNEMPTVSNRLRKTTGELYLANQQPQRLCELQIRNGPELATTAESHARVIEPSQPPDRKPERAKRNVPRSVSASRTLQSSAGNEGAIASKQQSLSHLKHHQVPGRAQRSFSANRALQPGQLAAEAIVSLRGERSAVRESLQPRSQRARECWKDRLRLQRRITNRSLSPPQTRFDLSPSITLRNDHVPCRTINDHSQPLSHSQHEEVMATLLQPSDEASSINTFSAEKKHADLIEKMLQECFSAIVNLKKTSESKYETLESRYLELRGSFSHLEAQSRPRYGQAESTPDGREAKARALEIKRLELKNSIAQVGAMNCKLIDENRNKESQHQALEESLLQLETQNRQLREILGNDDKYQAIRESIMRVEERNIQLMHQVQLIEKLQAHCQNLDERCALLQSGLSEIEEDNLKLRNGNLGLQTKCQTLEDQCQKWETSYHSLEAEEKLMISEKDSLHAKYKTLEATCQRLEESNSALADQVLHITNDREVAQSKEKELGAQNMIMEEFNKDMQARCRLLQDESDLHESKFQHLMANCTQREREREGYESDLQQARERCLALEEINAEIQVRNQSLQHAKDEYQSKLQDLELNCKRLEKSNGQLMDQNFQLANTNRHLQSTLREVEYSLAAAKANADLITVKTKQDQCSQDLKAENAKHENLINDLKTKNALLEQSIEYWKTENAKVEAVNKSLKETQTRPEGSLEKATGEVEKLCTVKAIFASHDQPETEPEETGVGFISNSSSDSSDLMFNPNYSEPSSRLGYEVISSQELQSFNVSLMPSSNTLVEESNVGSVHVEGRRSGTRTLEDHLREKLIQLSSLGSGPSDDEGRYVEAPEKCPHAKGSRALYIKTRKDMGESALSGKNQSTGVSRSRSLPPLSPRPAFRPPLPPTTSTSHNSNNARDEVDVRPDESLETSSAESDSSGYPSPSDKNRAEAQPSLQRGKREQSPSSILQELLREHHRGEVKDTTDKDSFGQQALRTTKPASSEPDARHSEQSSKSRERRSTSRSPGSRDGRSHEHGLKRSTSPSPPKAAPLGSCAFEETKTVPEVGLANEESEKPSRKSFVEPKISNTRSDSKRRVAEGACDKTISESTTEDETNSIVTHSSTGTQDLPNIPLPKHPEHKTEKSMDTTIETEQNSSCSDCFMPFGVGSSRRDAEQTPAPSESLPVAIRPNVRDRCDESGCGVDYNPCTSILARRTWNFGKKQGQAASRNLVSNVNSEISSLATIPTSPNGGTTGIARGARTVKVTLHREITSFESSSSDNGYVSCIRAKRDKLRRKQGQSFIQAASSSSSSQSEPETAKEDKKASTKPPTTVFPFRF